MKTDALVLAAQLGPKQTLQYYYKASHQKLSLIIYHSLDYIVLFFDYLIMLDVCFFLYFILTKEMVHMRDVCAKNCSGQISKERIPII